MHGLAWGWYLNPSVVGQQSIALYSFLFQCLFSAPPIRVCLCFFLVDNIASSRIVAMASDNMEDVLTKSGVDSNLTNFLMMEGWLLNMAAADSQGFEDVPLHAFAYYMLVWEAVPARTNAWTTERYRPTRTSSTSEGPRSMEVLGRGSKTSSSADESEELSELLSDESKKSGGVISADALNWNHWKLNGWRGFTNFSNSIDSTIGAWLPRCCEWPDSIRSELPKLSCADMSERPNHIVSMCPNCY